MSPPKRQRIENAAYHITSVVYDRLPIFVTSAYVIPLFDNLNFYRARYAMRLLGYVIMPDHVHLLVWPSDDNLSGFMRAFKSMTAKRIILQADAEGRVDLLEFFADAGRKTDRSQNKVWQDSFWEVTLISEKFILEKLAYIHENPLRAQIVSSPDKYPYSSYRNYVFGEEYFTTVDRGWL